MNKAIVEMVVPGAIVCGEAIARFFPAVGEFIGNHNILVSAILGLWWIFVVGLFCWFIYERDLMTERLGEDVASVICVGLFGCILLLSMTLYLVNTDPSSSIEFLFGSVAAYFFPRLFCKLKKN